MIVVDVTVLAHYLIEGDETPAVVELREREAEWAAPGLWRSELLNVLWKYLLRGDFGLDLALRHMDLAADLVAGRVYEPRPEEVLSLAVASGCSAYDCQYVALARRLDTVLATHDRRLLGAFPDHARHPRDVGRGR